MMCIYKMQNKPSQDTYRGLPSYEVAELELISIFFQVKCPVMLDQGFKKFYLFLMSILLFHV